MEIKLVDNSNFNRDSLKDFRRYQEVKNVYRLKDGALTLVSLPFIEDWDAARCTKKAEEILSGKYITYCAMGFRLSPDPIPSCMVDEPYDLQMECPLK